MNIRQGQRQRRIQRRDEGKRRRPAAIERCAGSSVDQRLQYQVASLKQHPDAVGAIKLVCGQTDRIDPLKGKRDLPDGLRRIHMQPAVRIFSHDLRDFPDWLDRAEFAVNRSHGNEHGVRAQQFPQMPAAWR